MRNEPNFFFLLISPPKKIIQHVASLKSLVRKIIGHSYNSLHSIAHITLHQYPDFHNEGQLYDFSERISRIRAFTIYVRDFRLFKNNGTIYLNPYAPVLTDVFREVTGLSFVPHITIAKNLNPSDTERVWDVIKDYHCNYFFKCKFVTVLKRIDNRWQPHLCIPLAH